jgi:hypothetical protein
LSLYDYFVTVPYAVLGIQMAMLFIYNGLLLGQDGQTMPDFRLVISLGRWIKEKRA